MGKLIVVVGGQYGSEAKGHVCAYLGEQEDDLLAIRVGGPNAGHTAIDNGTAFPFRTVPVAAVRPAKRRTRLAIGAGSEIDYGVLYDELDALAEYGYDTDLTIDPSATWLGHDHIEQERNGATGQHGSTQKGIGAARAARLLRHAELWGGQSTDLLGFGAKSNDVARLAHDQLAGGGTVLIEGTQGYKLGTHAGDYPFCTSGDARAIDFMAQAGISPWDPAIDELEVWVTFRTYPIRIAGNSGPMLNELEWETLAQRSRGHIKPEFTTVTKKQRRIAEWDHQLAQDAIAANGGDVKLALMFFDYKFPGWAGRTTADLNRSHPDEWATLRFLLHSVERAHFPGRKVDLLGTGPQSIIDCRVG